MVTAGRTRDERIRKNKRHFVPRHPTQRSSLVATPRSRRWRRPQRTAIVARCAAQCSLDMPLRMGDGRASRVLRGDGLATAGFGKLERTLLAAQDQLADSATRTATALVAVYKALGGGWEIAPEGAYAQAP